MIYDNLIGGRGRSIDGRIVPYALYTDPELGRVGMSEKEARAAGYRLKVGSIPMSYVARAIERSETRGLMKVVINAEGNGNLLYLPIDKLMEQPRRTTAADQVESTMTVERPSVTTTPASEDRTRGSR